ncbi:MULTISPECIES: cytochrome d ubiquinol oxidase subunit II [unclassified Leucobacter]|uniref:cytochrome d ubiquinol oxidase subunit II n=1 Tax=unclassified Leucobacter TaxID=2621730 RepID=UPI00165E23D6|nr:MULTISPECIES: cytochrome d ubiquinol oxidase subunit II [unclassified Leucobacter]MBC9935156.1 cytochrome d ubiquinol oxidase subunit II [Leucobacter sp. cx-87]
MDLSILWFFIVGVFLVGYFVLDGFDFGVGMAMPFISKDDTDRRVVINTIGPVWDLNETWLIVAGACLFAAFPEWYATMFSGFYLALLLILVALIVRGVSFEYRHQGKGARWTGWFDRAIVFGSFLPPLLWGTAFASLLQGVPIEKMDNGGWLFTGTLLDLLTPYALLGGVTLMLLCFVHGAVFVALKSDGEIRVRARGLATKVGLAAIVAGAAFLGWTLMLRLDHEYLGIMIALAGLAAAALILAWVANLRGREGWAFTGNAAAIAFALLTIFMGLFPNLMISSTDPAYTMSISGAASSQGTLELMTWVAVFTMPLVLAYQAWTYWVFRKRVSRANIPVAAH